MRKGIFILEEFLRGDLIKYGIIIITVFAVMLKVVQAVVYIKLMEESENVPASKNKLIKQMKLKFENCYKLNLGVNNVRIFVDKYMYKHKIGRINMYYLNRLPIIAAWFCGIVGIGSGCICYLEKYSVKMGSVYEVYGIGSIIIIKLAEIILDTAYKRNVFYTNIIDFFENSLQNHLTHDVTKAAAITEEEREMLEEIPVIKEVRRENASKETVFHYRKREKNKVKEPQSNESSNAADIIEDVISQFLS